LFVNNGLLIYRQLKLKLVYGIKDFVLLLRGKKMRPTQPYCPFLPQTSQIPAECVFPSSCRALQSVINIPIPNSSFPTPNCTYTFSAKEKDAETGYSYFGSRYYSSDLSVWLSVDPMAAKYPSTSPYAYCRNKPIILVDPNGMFDRKSRAQRVRDRAAKRYGEDRVSDVFNNTIDGGKANYVFRIYGEGKTKYSYGGGTNDQGGPVITCDKPDKVVFKRRDFRDYKESFTMAGYYREQISKSSGVDKFGYRLKLAGEKVHFDEQNFVDGAGPYLQGLVLAIPLVGVPNDIKTVFSESDIYGNQSSTFGRVVSGLDALSFAGLSIQLFDVTLPKGFEKALNATNKTTTIYSVGSTINDQKSGTKKGGGDE